MVKSELANANASNQHRHTRVLSDWRMAMGPGTDGMSKILQDLVRIAILPTASTAVGDLIGTGTGPGSNRVRQAGFGCCQKPRGICPLVLGYRSVVLMACAHNGS